MPTIDTPRRWIHSVAGAALVGVGLTGLAATWSAPALARSTGAERGHEATHQMMDAMHGEGTADAMHQVEGAEEMMDECTSMMGGMGDMMGGVGMMGGMSG
ncbi:MAG: hypothetical protein KY461_02220 [Actinobacteria bacterium]|nr:hypothetical protein [Actinomycetota bacterium]